MISNLSPSEKLFCTGGDCCNCVCWKAIDDERGYEIIFGEVEGVNLNIGLVSISLGAATKCRAECNLNSYKFRRCEAV